MHNKYIKGTITSGSLAMMITRAKAELDSLREKDIIEMFNMSDSTFEMPEHGSIHTRILV